MLKRATAATPLEVSSASQRPHLNPRRIALVARDWLTESSRGSGRFADRNMGFAPHFTEIAQAASARGADLLLYNLWSHDADKFGRLTRADLFPRGTRHQAVLLEVRDGGTDQVHLWTRRHKSPIRLVQMFARSSDSRTRRSSFASQLGSRTFGACLVLLCGESNIIKTQRGTRAIEDEFQILRRLKPAGVTTVLNPLHDYMRRYEMPLKRMAFSRAAGCAVSVWNRGCKDGSEARLPWAAYRDGKDITSSIEEIPVPVRGQPGVRVGLLTLR